MRAQTCLAAAIAVLVTNQAAAFGIKPVAGVRAADVVTIAKRQRAQMPKDCTRYNGRHGFYGNIWCTEAEQRAWDIYTSRHSLSATRR